jgi:hypothetical protein
MFGRARRETEALPERSNAAPAGTEAALEGKTGRAGYFAM